MTTEIAQRCLLEALGELRNTPGLDIGQQSDPLAALLVGIHEATGFAEAMGQPGIARVYAALGDLVSAVREDHKREGVSRG